MTTILGLGLWLIATAQAAPTTSSCIYCHRTAEAVPYLEHDFSDWSASPHAKAGVSCQDCHGGDPGASDKAGAHKAMRRSTDPGSPVYFTAVPRTCGACHAAEYRAFRDSRHYRELARTGRGPNCVTCHGSMANGVPAPRELERTCTLCHRKPTRAYATLLSLNTAAAALKRLGAALERGRAGGLDVRAQTGERSRVEKLHARAVVDWHTFKMDAVLRASQEAARAANTAALEIELKERQHGKSGH